MLFLIEGIIQARLCAANGESIRAADMRIQAKKLCKHGMGICGSALLRRELSAA